MQNSDNKARMEKWKVQSSTEPGFHPVITPETAESREEHIYRLNLPAGDAYELVSGELEIHPVLIAGKAKLSGHDSLDQEMTRFDAFYIPAGEKVTITALDDCFFYIAGAKYDGFGSAFFRKFEPDAPLGDIHQIHGKGVGEREVYMTLSDKDEASRIIAGVTWSREGTWTSWPPHQHEKDLEEVYCYFDIPEPKFGFHVSYLKSGETDDIVVHTVHTGTCVEAPCGYHPTCASPGSKNAYFWVLAAFSHESRRYDLAKEDPAFAG